MDPVLITLIVLAALVVVYAIFIYNHLVRLKHNVSRAFANIDVLLKQRHDELPKLVATCKQHMGYEQQTLERVMQARPPWPAPATGATSRPWDRRKANCDWGWATCSPWPKPTRS